MNVIYSRSGTGKSRECLARLEEAVRQGQKAYMIVPEQFSYEAERRLCMRLGGTGINGAEALTFGRLLRLLSPVQKPAADSAGKYMLIYKAAQKAEKSGDKTFAGSLSSNGFLSSVSDMISEFKRFNISEDSLLGVCESIAGSAGSDMLRKKTQLMYEIYKNYNSSITDLRDTDDDMLRLAGLIYSGNQLADVHIFIDEFYSFIPYHYSVISALESRAASVSIFLTADHEAKLSYDTDNIFSPTVRIIHSLENLAKDSGFEINEEYLSDTAYRFAVSEELRLLESSFDKPAAAVYDGEVSDIQLFAAGNIFSEIEKAAIEITKSVNGGYRYRDIGMLCGDLENYADIIEAVFRNYNIPYFIDMKKNIVSHPIIIAVTSIFDVFAKSWSYDSVFSYIRTGFSALDDHEADVLENFVLAHGIRGEKRWRSEWEYSSTDIFAVDADEKAQDDEKNLYINELRKKVCEPFFRFKDKFDGRKTIREICGCLYEMLDKDLDMPDKIEKKARYLRDIGMNDDSEQFLKLWNILISLLDQIVMVMGDDFCGFEKFSEIITVGFSKYEIGIIPSSADRVSIGTVDRTRSVNIKKMMIIGANSSNIPKAAENRSIFSDSERRTLTGAGLNIEDVKKDRLFDDQFKIYKALTAAKEKLYISWSASDWEGKSMQKAEFVNDIIRRFPDIKTEDNFLGTDLEEYLNAPAEAVFSHILSGWISGGDKRYEQVIKWYEGNDKFRARVKAAEYLKNYTRDTRRLSPETVEKLYRNNHLYSVSRLNVFAKCPFQYFLQYGINARPQKKWGVEYYDAGTFIHHYIDKFCKTIEAEKTADTLEETKRVWRECDDEKCIRIIDGFMEDARRQILARNISGSTAHMLTMMKRNITGAVMDIRNSLNAGEFAVDKTEMPFPDFRITADDGRTVSLHGIIDRIDVFKDGEDIYIRIIDYKTGTTGFDLEKIYNNMDFQLFIYAQAAAEIYKRNLAAEVNTAGVMYFPLRRSCNTAESFSDKDIDKNLINMKKLDGVIIDDIENMKITKYMDRDIPEKSDYLKSVVLSRGSFDKKKSQFISSENFRKLCGYVNKGVIAADRDISEGDISICPSAEGDKSVCNYCNYDDICMFNSGRQKKVKKLSGNFSAKIEAFIKEIDSRGGNDNGNDA